MDIVLFKDLTTSEALSALKAEGEKYQGLYVDMNDSKARKYVKEQAQHIKGLKKQVDRKRIDMAKEYKAAVEKEAASIIEDLNIANSPFELLIDDYTAERKKILDAEKARKKAIEDAIQLENDHEIALLMNDKFDLDQVKLAAEKAAHEEQIKKDAIKAQAEQAERDRIANEQALEAAEQRRLADVDAAKLAEQQRISDQKAAEEMEAARKAADIEHVKLKNNEALTDFVKLGLSENNAKAVISAIAKNLISNITINY